MKKIEKNREININLESFNIFEKEIIKDSEYNEIFLLSNDFSEFFRNFIDEKNKFKNNQNIQIPLLESDIESENEYYYIKKISEYDNNIEFNIEYEDRDSNILYKFNLIFKLSDDNMNYDDLRDSFIEYLIFDIYLNIIDEYFKYQKEKSYIFDISEIISDMIYSYHE